MNLDRIVKLLPLGAAILIGLGVLKTSVYYNYFGVDIMSYLSTSDVITLFLNDYIPVLTFVIIGYIHFDFSNRTIDFIERKIIHIDFQILLRKYKWIYFAVVFSIFATLSSLLYFHKIRIYDFWIYFLVFSTSNLIAIFFINKDLEKPYYSSEKLVDFLHIIALVCAIPLLSLKDIRKIENNYKLVRITLELEDNSVVKSDFKNKYLGKAGNYYFFFDGRKNKTTIVKAEDVKQIEIKI